MTPISQTLSGVGKTIAKPTDSKGSTHFNNTYEIAAATSLLRPTAQYGKWQAVCQRNDSLANSLAKMILERHDLLKKAQNGQSINSSQFNNLTDRLAQNNIHLYSSEQLDLPAPGPKPDQKVSSSGLPEVNTPNSPVPMPAAAPLAQPGKKVIPNGFSSDEEVIMDMRYGNHILSPAFLGYGKGQDLFLPLAELTRILDFSIAVNAEKGRADGWFLSEERQFSIDINSGKVMIEGQSAELLPDSLFVRDGDIYVDTKTLSNCFPVDFDYNFSQQSLYIDPREELPFQEKLAREERWGKNRGRRANPAQLPLKESDYKFLEAPFLDFGFSGNYYNSDNSTNGVPGFYLLGKGDMAKMSSEFYLTGDSKDGLNTARLTLAKNDPQGELLGPLKATHFSIGDVRVPDFSIVGNSKYETGLVVGNYPLNTPSEYDTTFFAGNLSPGWDVELHQNGVLLSTQRVGAEGRYDFKDVPLYYGNNDFDLKFFGPQGQERIQTERIVVGNEMIKKGSSQYQFSLTQKDEKLFDPRNLQGTMDKDSPRIVAKYAYGLDKAVSLESGLFSQETNGERHNYLNLGGQGYVKDAYVKGSYIHDMAGGDAVEVLAQKRVGPLDLKVKQRFYHNFLEEGQTNESDKLRSRTDISTSGRIKATEFTPDIPFSFNYQSTIRDNSQEKILGNRLSTSFKGVYLNNYLKWKENTYLTSDSTVLDGTANINTQLGKVRLRAFADYELKPENEITKAQASALYPITNELNSELTLTQDLRSKDLTTGNVALNWNNGKFILSPQVSYDSDGKFNAFFSFSTSLGKEPRSDKVKFSSARQADQGAVSARVFYDKNNNQRFDQGDELIPGAEVEADQANKIAKTDEEGIAFLTGLPKYKPTDITLKTESLDDPFWEPSQKGNSIIPRPGHVDMVDIPVVTTGEIDGTLYMESKTGEKRPLKHMPVQLVDKSGTVVQNIKSEYDGFYLFMKVPPGDYFVRLDPAYEKNLDGDKLSPIPVEIGNDGTVAAGVDLVFKPPAPALAPKGVQSDPDPSPLVVFETSKSEMHRESIVPIKSPIPKDENPVVVKTEPVSEPATTGPVSESAKPQMPSIGTQHFGLHLSSYRTLEDAVAGIQYQKNKFRDFLEDKDFTIQKTDLGPQKGAWYRVVAGGGDNLDQVAQLGRSIKNREPYAKTVSIGDGSKSGVHLTSFRSKAKAMENIEELKASYPDLLRDENFTIKTVNLGPKKGVWHRVIVGSFTNESQARVLGSRIKYKRPYCTPVKIERTDQFSIHMASYRSLDKASKGVEKLMKEVGPLLGEHLSIRQVDLGEKGSWYRVLAGRFDDKSAANALEDSLKANGLYAQSMDFSFLEQ